jgi:DNA-binding NarL/FixJ family response regulator
MIPADVGPVIAEFSMKLPCEKSRPCLLLADDHIVFLEALRSLLEKTYEVIGSVMDGRALVTEALRLKPDIIIVDVDMPLLNGFDAACRVVQQLPEVRPVFLTMMNDPNLAAAALELGAVGFVSKHSAADELVAAINQVWHGKSYLSPELRTDDWVERRARVKQFSRDLTPRQRDVVQLFAEGYCRKEIAQRLNLSKRTIEFHKHQIMSAYKLKSNADLVLLAVKKGLVTVKPEFRHASHGELPNHHN